MKKKKVFNKDLVATVEELLFYGQLPIKEVIKKKGLKEALKQKLVKNVQYVEITNKGARYLDDYEDSL